MTIITTATPHQKGTRRRPEKTASSKQPLPTGETTLRPADLCLDPAIIARIHGPFDYQPPADRGLDVVHEDATLLAVNKPAGLLTVAGRDAAHADCLECRVTDRYPDARLVHRLDKDTSGIIVFARTKEAHRNLGLQFERRHARKMYTALVDGAVHPDTGSIEAPLRCDWPNRPLQTIDWNAGRAALTHWHVQRRHTDQTRLRLIPHTGRSHQLRVHLLAIGHPILGDAFYAPEPIWKRTARLMLHASVLEIRHPEGGQSIEFSAHCPF